MTKRSATPPNNEGSVDVASSARVPYSLPNDRRQKAAKKDLVFISSALPPTPDLRSMLVRTQWQRNKGGAGNNLDCNSDVAASFSQTPP